MKRVLIISYHFPPINNIAARLSRGLALNMSKFGWEPFVLTTKSKGNLPALIPEENIIRIGENYHSNKKLVSEEGYKGIPSILKAFYFFYKKFGIGIASIDRFLFSWGKEALKQTEKIKKINPDVILATCYPPTSIWLGHILSKKLKKPWVADFRDICSLYNISKFPFIKFIDKTIDKLLVKNAAFIITVGPYLASVMRDFYHKPVQVIYNGFDNIEKTLPENSLIKEKKNKIIYYAGRFHPHRLSPVKLLINWMAQKRKDNLILKIRSLGPAEANAEILRYAKEKKIISNIHLLEPASSDVVHREEKEANVLVVFEDLKESKPIFQGAMTGKLFEYLPFSAPIVVIARPDSDMATVLKDTSRGYLVSNLKQLDEVLEDILKGKILKPNWERVKNYSFEKQSKILCNLLNQIA